MIDSCRVMIKARQGDDVMQLVRAGGCGAAGLCLHALHCGSQAFGAQQCLHTCSSTGNYRWELRLALACQCEKRHPGRGWWRPVRALVTGAGMGTTNRACGMKAVNRQRIKQHVDSCWTKKGKGGQGTGELDNGESGAHAQDDDQSLFVEQNFKCGIIKSPLFYGCSSHPLAVRRAKWISESIPHGLAA